MTIEKLVLSIILMGGVTFSTRLFPFIVFGANSSPSRIVLYLGKYLPPTIISAILIYCFKDVQITQAPFGLYEVIAVAVCAALHLWKGNTMISIFVSTGVYMLLKNFEL